MDLPSDPQVIDVVETDVQRPVQSEVSEEESSSTEQLQLAAPVLNTPVETPRPSMVSVLCGHQDPKSWYLTRRLVRMPGNEGDDLVSILKHRNIDPAAAELHQIWRHTGIIPTLYRDINFDPDGINPQHTWIACWPLINAAIHGYMLNDTEFVDRVMDLLEEKIVNGVRPDVDTIFHVFGEKRQHIPMTLQRFLVVRWIDSSPRGFDDVDPHSLPEFFVCAALDTATRRLSHVAQRPSLSGCQYHTHSKSEGCYNQRIMPADATRQERYKYRREKASREAEQVAADSIVFGIATLDWKERRAEAHQALHDQVDDYSLTADSRIKASAPNLEADLSRKLELTKEADLPQREPDPESYASGSGVAQAEGAADEVKVAPAPPPPTSMHADHSNSNVGGAQCFQELPTQEEVAMPSNRDAMPVAEEVDSSEPTLSHAPAIAPQSNACARAALGESSRQRKRRTCPGSFPESRSGSVTNIVLA
ncbi:hypothetical protein G6011_00144 [Alternaria panax]|uniref:Uncharacterized protein n=1 Tax=Alternaria panax TaxID=48097 RepID=A0AAD4NUS3_9PLEO|nr:hypothetical protein G6011_00144 [Alternaria panax]